MVEERLADWKAERSNPHKTNTSTQVFPNHIIYFRDGVSEGQYPAVSYTHLTLPTKRIV